MAFINEKISEIEKTKIDMEKLLSTKLCSYEPTFWVVNHDINVFLLPLGGGGPERPEFYALFVQGELITFHANRRGSGNNKIGIGIFYKISCLIIPQTIEARIEEVKQLICEALDAYGQYGNRSHVTSVVVEFNNMGRG